MGIFTLREERTKPTLAFRGKESLSPVRITSFTVGCGGSWLGWSVNFIDRLDSTGILFSKLSGNVFVAPREVCGLRASALPRRGREMQDLRPQVRPPEWICIFSPKGPVVCNVQLCCGTPIAVVLKSIKPVLALLLFNWLHGKSLHS